MNQPDPRFLQWIQNIERAAAGANAQARQALAGFQQALAEVEDVKQAAATQNADMNRLMGMMQGMQVGKGGTGKSGIGASQVGRPDMLTIEEIPGRRIPYDLTVQIGVPDSQTAPLTGHHPLSTDGPFIAVARYATFISSYTFQVTTEAATERYTGRTWGRQRPISSVLDLMDALPGWVDGVTSDLDGDCEDPATPLPPAVISRPTSRAGQRSMVFDGYIEVQSSVYPRQNQHVPTSLWAPGFNQLLQLPVLDYWEKGETIEIQIEPLHVNNPSAGNVQTLLGSMPYLAGQFDGHEGVMYPEWECDDDVADIIQRRPSGVLVVGFLGYKILQPPGVRMR